MAMPVWIGEKLFQKDRCCEKALRHRSGLRRAKKLLFTEHHLSHAASRILSLRPFEEAAILTIDGVGEWATTSVAVGQRQ